MLQVFNADGTPASLTTRAITFTIDGGGAVPALGIKGDISVPYGGRILAARLLADQAGAAVLDIWRRPFATHPSTVADSITASAPPTLTAAAKSEDTTLVGWSPAFAAGDVFRINLVSASVLTRLMLTLTVAT